jgi:hypothetical protein
MSRCQQERRLGTILKIILLPSRSPPPSHPTFILKQYMALAKGEKDWDKAGGCSTGYYMVKNNSEAMTISFINFQINASTPLPRTISIKVACITLMIYLNISDFNL